MARQGLVFWSPERVTKAVQCAREATSWPHAAAIYRERFGDNVSPNGMRHALRRIVGDRPFALAKLGITTRAGIAPMFGAPPVETAPQPSQVSTPAAVQASVDRLGKIRRAIAVIGGGMPGRYRILHVTDVHHGSTWCDAKALLDLFEIGKSKGVCAVVNTGDTVDGVDERYQFEQRAVGYDDQCDEAVEVWSSAKLTVPVVAIGGNHDAKAKDKAGIDGNRVLAEKMAAAGVDWRYVGSCLGRAIIFGAKFELYHPHGGGSTRNAVRRVLNAKAEHYMPEDRPDILLSGHFHKFAVVHAYPENIFCVGGGTFQRREHDFGVRMIHPWDIGGSIISWTVSPDGKIGEQAVEFYSLRPEVRGWHTETVILGEQHAGNTLGRR